jgi:hypothetical protein
MSGYSDDPRDPDRERTPDDHDGRRRRPGDERAVAAARSALAAPGTFLILNGLFGLVVVGLLSIPMVFQPELMIKALRNLIAQQPPGPERKDAEDQLDEAEKEMKKNRAATVAQNAAELGVMAVANLLAIVGGFAMRSMGNYGLSMAGAIASIVPGVTGCCCTGMPFGIWALVVLMRADVKDGYAARRRLAADPDGF